MVSESLLRKMMEEQPETILPCPEAEGYTVLRVDGVPVGIRIFDASAGIGAGGGEYLRYTADDPAAAEDYYLCFGAESCHLKGGKDAVDNAAWEVAMELLGLKWG